ncbi:MAG: hypothetical protein NT166_09460 [Candidatus Aminicenantes bacterium]|nr:hypothetical protein [Candidatus Aminicenantes bacterium]
MKILLTIGGMPGKLSTKLNLMNKGITVETTHKFAVPTLDQFGESGKYLRDNLNEHTFAKKVSSCDGDFNF